MLSPLSDRWREQEVHCHQQITGLIYVIFKQVRQLLMWSFHISQVLQSKTVTTATVTSES